MSRPRTIQIYLPSGDPRGVRVAELTTSIVRVIEVPRALLDEFYLMPESRQVGVYFLIGDNDGADRSGVYVGQTGVLGDRLANHHKEKEFWHRAFVVVSLTNSLTQTHALFLEWCSIKYANETARYRVMNGNGGSKPHTPAPLEADCVEIFETARTLLATLGQPIFEPVATAPGNLSPEEVYYLKGGSYNAVGEYTEEGFVVLKNSKARKDIAASLQQTSFVKRRQTLIQDGALQELDGFLVFQRDTLFKTPSGASDMVTGMSTNGWAVWKAKSGKTLSELKRQRPVN